MFYGNCISYKSINQIKILKETGFDYIETALAPLYSATDSEINDFLSALDENNIKCEAVNVLFPGDISLTGPNVNKNKIESYINEIFDKTKDFGFKSVVFGSGGARRYPDGFDKEKATEQIIEVINKYLIPAAEKYNFKIAIEELNSNETNILNKLSEVEYVINQVNHPRVKFVADIYHINLENDIDKLSPMGNLIAHCHISNIPRNYPHATDDIKSVNMCEEFINILKSAGYNGRISIEAGLGGLKDIENIDIPDWVNDSDKLFYAESKKSLEFMKSLE